jgi:hypothetical protein
MRFSTIRPGNCPGSTLTLWWTGAFLRRRTVERGNVAVRVAWRERRQWQIKIDGIWSLLGWRSRRGCWFRNLRFLISRSTNRSVPVRLIVVVATALVQEGVRVADMPVITTETTRVYRKGCIGEGRGRDVTGYHVGSVEDGRVVLWNRRISVALTMSKGRLPRSTSVGLGRRRLSHG